MVARNAPTLLKKPCFCCFVAVSVVLGCALFFCVSGGGKTTGSSCMTLFLSSFSVATVSVRSGAGSVARKTNGASTATCSWGEGMGRGCAGGATGGDGLDSNGGGGGGAALATCTGAATGHPQLRLERTASLRWP